MNVQSSWNKRALPGPIIPKTTLKKGVLIHA